MFDLYEAFRIMNELFEEENDVHIIQIDVEVDSQMDESVPSGNISDKYDDQTLEDWYDFAANVENIVENLCEVVSINTSKNSNSLSEYIDFYVYDKDGNRKKCLIDLRLSDHGATEKAKFIRKRKAKRIDKDTKNMSIIVNEKSRLNTYDKALSELRNYIAKELMG